jgi:hypothetical protein
LTPDGGPRRDARRRRAAVRPRPAARGLRRLDRRPARRPPRLRPPRRDARPAHGRRRARPHPHRRGPRAPRDARRALRRPSCWPTARWHSRRAAATRSATRRRRDGGSSSSPSCCSTWRASTTRRTPTASVVELIFFPTGGGKTEAYLGVIAFALVLRRLRGRSRPDGGYGVAVLLRYTLRLLTLDQLQRAATLVCALETLRRASPETLGAVRFSVGLWVGRTATANTLAEVSEKITAWKNARDSKTAPSPLPLTQCPWCGTDLDPDTVTLQPSKSQPTHVTLLCKNFRGCDFGQGNKPYADEGLPLVFVDEQVYRELPSFLVATVDKFAMVPVARRSGHALRPRALAGGAAVLRHAGRPGARARRGGVARGAAPARAHRAGRASPHLGPARHDGGPVRDRHRGAVHRPGAPQAPRLHGDGAPRPTADSLALRPRSGEPSSPRRARTRARPSSPGSTAPRTAAPTWASRREAGP